MDANDAASYVQELAGDDANIIFGAMYDDTYADEAKITVIATGLDSATATQPSVGKKIVPEFGSYAESEKSAPSNVSPFQKRTAPQLRTHRQRILHPVLENAHPGEQSKRTGYPDSGFPEKKIKISKKGRFYAAFLR